LGRWGRREKKAGPTQHNVERAVRRGRFKSLEEENIKRKGRERKKTSATTSSARQKRKRKRKGFITQSFGGLPPDRSRTQKKKRSRQ